MVEVSLLGDTGNRPAPALAPAPAPAPASGNATTGSPAAESPRRMSRTSTRTRDTAGEGAGPAEIGMELTATPQQLLHRYAENESLDLTRLVSHLLLPPSSLPRGRYPSREQQLATEMELLGLSQAAASGGDISNHSYDCDTGILRSAGDSNTGTGGAGGEAAVAAAETAESTGTAGLGTEAPVSVGVHAAGLHNSAAAITVPVASAPAVPFWRQASRAPSSTTRVIALTSPDQQEVMLAVHRSIPPTPSFR